MALFALFLFFLNPFLAGNDERFIDQFAPLTGIFGDGDVRIVEFLEAEVHEVLLEVLVPSVTRYTFTAFRIGFCGLNSAWTHELGKSVIGHGDEVAKEVQAFAG